MLNYAYLLGCRTAFVKLGMPYQEMEAEAEEAPPFVNEESEVPDELLAALIAEQGQDPNAVTPDEEQAPTADMFVDFANQDNTDSEADPNMQISEAPGTENNKKPSWSGKSSLEAGDAGTRNHEMGLPSFSGA